MKISAIQNQLSSAKSHSSANNTTSMSYLKDNSSDSFSKGNHVSFKGWGGAKAGGTLGVIGAFIAGGVVIATGGLAGPAIAIFYGAVAAAPAVGAALGSGAEEAAKAVKKIK